MKKYTFIFEYKRGTYIKQISAPSLKDSILIWGSLINSSEIPGFDDLKQKQLIKQIQNETACLLDGMENVWCLFPRVGYSSHLLNIVATL